MCFIVSLCDRIDSLINELNRKQRSKWHCDTKAMYISLYAVCVAATATCGFIIFYVAPRSVFYWFTKSHSFNFLFWIFSPLQNCLKKSAWLLIASSKIHRQNIHSNSVMNGDTNAKTRNQKKTPIKHLFYWYYISFESRNNDKINLMADAKVSKQFMVEQKFINLCIVNKMIALLLFFFAIERAETPEESTWSTRKLTNRNYAELRGQEW